MIEISPTEAGRNTMRTTGDDLKDEKNDRFQNHINGLRARSPEIR